MCDDSAYPLQDGLHLLDARFRNVEPAGERIRVLESGSAMVQVVDHVIVSVALLVSKVKVLLVAQGALRTGNYQDGHSWWGKFWLCSRFSGMWRGGWVLLLSAWPARRSRSSHRRFLAVREWLQCHLGLALGYCLCTDYLLEVLLDGERPFYRWKDWHIPSLRTWLTSSTCPPPLFRSCSSLDWRSFINYCLSAIYLSIRIFNLWKLKRPLSTILK